jgi:hypothetical protein
MRRRKRTAVVAVLAAAGTATITAFATGAASFGGGHGKLSPELGSPMSLDNTSFLSRDTFGVVEDAGDTLHGQRNALDSGYALDVDLDYANPANQPVRWLAEGRDASAAIDSAFNGFGKNDGDNELTGIHVSDGDPSVQGVLGAKTPKLWHDGWRWFYTQQHGDNPMYEVVPSR